MRPYRRQTARPLGAFCRNRQKRNSPIPSHIPSPFPFLALREAKRGYLLESSRDTTRLSRTRFCFSAYAIRTFFLEYGGHAHRLLDAPRLSYVIHSTTPDAHFGSRVWGPPEIRPEPRGRVGTRRPKLTCTQPDIRGKKANILSCRPLCLFLEGEADRAPTPPFFGCSSSSKD